MDRRLLAKRRQLDDAVRERSSAQQIYMQARDAYYQKAGLLKQAREEGDREAGSLLRGDLDELKPALEADRTRIRRLSEEIKEASDEYRALRARVQAGRESFGQADGGETRGAAGSNGHRTAGPS